VRRLTLSSWLLASIAVLPGCAVTAVWNGGKPELVEVVDRTYRRDVELAFGGAPDVVPVVPVGDADTPWSLRALRGGEEVDVLLRRAGLFVVRETQVDARRVYEGEDVTDDAAELTLVGTFAADAVATAFDEAALTPEARAVLARPRWNAFAETPEQRALPPLQRACVQRLTDVDLAHLLDRPRGSLQIVSWLFVDAAGRPRFDGGDTPAGPAAEPAPAPLPERLRLLAEGALLVRTVDAAGQRAYWRLRADSVWLAGGCEPVAGGFQHRSTWRLEPSPAAMPELPRRLPATLFVREQRSAWLGPAQHRLAQRLLLTPVAVALDSTILLPGYLFMKWFGSDDEDGEPTPVPK